KDVHSVDNDATPRQYTIGGSYDFEVVKLALAYARTEDGWFQAQSVNGVSSDAGLVGAGSLVFADGFRANSYLVGLSAPIGGASNIFASWQMVDPKNDKLMRVVRGQVEGKGNDEKMNIFSLGYTYDLSKRTNLYAYGSYAKNYGFID